MIDLSPEIVTIIMLGGVLVGVLIGYPLAIPVGAVGLIMGFLLFGTGVFDLLYARLFKLVHSYVLLAIPLFVFMGVMLERSGITERMYAALYLWLSGFRGGLAIITVLIGTILAACVGIIGASVTMLALLALPSMIKRGYSKSLASGSVCAGGTLGILIPPSIMLVIFGPMAGISVGKLFMAAFIPGLVLSGLYITYIAVRCFFQTKIAPAVPVEERAVPFLKKTATLVASLVPPGLLILAVLGSIFFGIAPPTEAAAVGALAATILTIAYRRFSFEVLSDTALQTLKVTSMILLIGGLSFAFVGVFIPAGGAKVVEAVIMGTPGGYWGAFAMVMFIIFLLGFFIDWIGIIFIMVPILAPIAPALGFDPLWFGMMIIINLQMSFMTPPFAAAIFYLRGSAPPELGVTMGDIIRGVFPFVGLIMIGLSLCVAFPQIILWLPAQMIK
ncbi:MAG TPA: TRAP transporter large permease subunit [Dehalococcoidia bacterium]|nr:TRAP transporter large permease subunit [Dehalococcoidia bacterium]HUV56796.1 TRAP transporter large permease subunit [Dehalococcoidales bacterium]